MARLIAIVNMYGDKVFIGKSVLQSWDRKQGLHWDGSVAIVYAGTSVDAIATPSYMKQVDYIPGYRCHYCNRPAIREATCECGRVPPIIEGPS